MKKFFAEFKEFALKGNALSMAVGIVIGAAFTAIVSSLVGDIISPILGIFGGDDLSNILIWNINGAEIKFGAFLTAIIHFIFIAFVLFLMIKFIAKMLVTGKNTSNNITTKDDTDTPTDKAAVEEKE
ncbi:MAG: large conductance mechanosensitive channel protein MscL [Chloroflexi bacterium]|nr:large conductance mechanosensitive channel protein MscL [Chloroflexota bacterium]